MKMINSLGKIIALFTLIFVIIIISTPLTAQRNKKLILSGKVYNSTTKKVIDFAMIGIKELNIKTHSNNDGSYQIEVPKPGEYTLIVKSEGLKMMSTKVSIDKNMNYDVWLMPLRIRGDSLTIVGDRDLQKVSRHTMTRKQMKEVPASFGDSINALASLPGIVRMGGDLFGPLVIRGGNFLGVNYYIDDIPIYDSMHFGGLHSVINSNLMSEVDLYASAFPVQFGYATSAIININTVDDVKEFGGYTDLSLLSATALVQTPILKDNLGSLSLGTPLYKKGDDYKNVGYLIFSGRTGYIDLIVAPLIELLTGDKLAAVPKYWDYQIKMKYYFNSNHSITVFLMGSSDYIKFLDDEYSRAIKKGDDPLSLGLKLNYDKKSNSQGLYYTYQPSDKFSNKFIAYSALMNSYVYLNLPAVGVNPALQGYHVDSKPYIFGLKDKFKLVLLEKYIELRGGVECNLYNFMVHGKNLRVTGKNLTMNLSDQDIYQPNYLNNTIINYTLGGYAETKLTMAGLTVVPGVRTDYLYRSGEATFDPRGLISYEFPTDTTLSVAMGRYSYLFQTNPFLFNDMPNIAKIGKELKSEKAIHRVVGIQQQIKDFTIKVEGYYNNFYDLPQAYYHYEPNGKPLEGMCSGKIKAYGVEVMLRKDKKENVDGIFGWVSYTYTRSRFKSGLPPVAGLYGNSANLVGDPFGFQWLNYEFEQQHSLKLITGYEFGRNTITGKFQLFSSMPYTPVVNGGEDLTYATNNPGYHRYYPIYGKPFSKHFPINHRLDIRYTNKTNYSWGYVSWYVEIINIYNYRPVIQQSWDYRIPYSPKNPKLKAVDTNLAFIPNFGVEVKF